MDETWDIVVVGGGLAGLTAAATAAGNGHSVLVLDGQAGGGRAATDRVGRFLFNRGGHALYRAGPGRDVLGRLGVRPVGSRPPLKGSQARLGDEVLLLPVNVGSGLRTGMLGARDKLGLGRIMAGLKRWRPEEVADRTAAQWFDDLDLDGTLRQFAEALMRLSSYIADPESVSADLVMQQIQLASTVGVDYLHGGWASLVDGLAAVAHQRGAKVETGAQVRVRCVRPDDSRVRVEMDERTILARRVILAAGPPEATAMLLPERPAAWTRLGPPARAACLDVGLASVPATRFLLGIDRPLYLSRHSPPTGMSPEGGSAYALLRYLRPDEDPAADVARAEMVEHSRVAGIDPDAAEECRYLHRMVACGALPTPETGGMRGRPSAGTGLPGVLVAGDWVGPDGHLADTALASGETAARTAVQGLDREGVVHTAA